MEVGGACAMVWRNKGLIGERAEKRCGSGSDWRRGSGVRLV